MDEPTEAVEAVEAVEGAPAEATPAEGGKRGRPRPEAVIARDEQVYAIVTEPMTRKQIAEATGMPESHAYLSLLRLRNDGRLVLERTGGGHMWSRTPAESADVTITE